MSELTKIPDESLEKAVRDLIAFNEFTFYSERDVDECTGLTFALEFLYCTLGLNDCDVDSAELIEQLVTKLDDTATRLNIANWEFVKANMPYSRSMSR